MGRPVLIFLCMKWQKKREDWKKALAYREKYDLYADSIHEHTQTVKLEEIQVKIQQSRTCPRKGTACHKQAAQ